MMRKGFSFLFLIVIFFIPFVAIAAKGTLQINVVNNTNANIDFSDIAAFKKGELASSNKDQLTIKTDEENELNGDLLVVKLNKSKEIKGFLQIHLAIPKDSNYKNNFTVVNSGKNGLSGTFSKKTWDGEGLKTTTLTIS